MALDQFVTHAALQDFANEKVNLAKDDVKEYRKQVNSLRDRLETYINEHDGYGLVKMLHSGSVAKGTALKSLNDMDVAVYLEKDATPGDDSQLLTWLRDRLIEVYKGWKKPEDFEYQKHCITVKFHGSGLDVDVVPVLYTGDPDDKGYLVDKSNGNRVLTSIPLHLKFIRKRKEKFGLGLAQLIRFIKFWKNAQIAQGEDFRFKSFLIELLVIHLFEQKELTGSNFPEDLTKFFGYICQTKLAEEIIFTDFYSASDVYRTGHPIQIFDPVNPENNVAASYSKVDQDALVELATNTVDAIIWGRECNLKGEAEKVWKEIFGPTFRVM